MTIRLRGLLIGLINLVLTVEEARGVPVLLNSLVLMLIKKAGGLFDV
jgi:hypothetical protein